VPGVTCSTNQTLGTVSYVAHVFGLPMQLNDYGGQVFVPLIMVAILAPLYRFLKKLIPDSIQMVFVPFLSMVVMIPLTAFLLGPLGIWLGSGIGGGLAWLNGHAPILFAIIIPLIYPFLVLLGLHWPLNARMLLNIQTLGYDFIQGPMGSWNFACFGPPLVFSSCPCETKMWRCGRQRRVLSLRVCWAESPSHPCTASTCASSGSTRACSSAVSSVVSSPASVAA
jgi:phosphotransferase system  glucose/maltose/N-acetylglucosamine-specific IIC component